MSDTKFALVRNAIDRLEPSGATFEEIILDVVVATGTVGAVSMGAWAIAVQISFIADHLVCNCATGFENRSSKSLSIAEIAKAAFILIFEINSLKS